ncbi:MAG: hypothetical protein ABIK89_07230 [Planctomycetota bacterium]
MRRPVYRAEASLTVGRRRRLTWLLMIVCLGLTPGVSSGEETPPAGTPGKPSQAAEAARSYVDDFSRRERLRAGNAFLERELQRLESAIEPGSPGEAFFADFQQIDAETAQTLLGMLEENVTPVVDDLDHAAETFDREVGEAQAAWRAVRTALYERRLLLFKVEGSRRIAGQLASLLSVDKRWFWLFGLVAIATLAGLVFHDRRHEFRRLLSGGRVRKMRLSKFLTVAAVVLAVLTVVTFLMGDRIYEALLSVGLPGDSSPRALIAAEQAALDSEMESLEQARQDLERRYRQAEYEHRQTLGDAIPARNQIPVQWGRFRAGVLEATELAALLDALPREIETDSGELGAVTRELEAQTEAAAGYLRLRQWVRGGLGLGLIVLAAVGGFLYRQGVEARRELTANTCPLCLGTDRLERLAEDVRRSRVPGGVEVVECKNVISEEPYEECDYTFMDVYREQVKLCFPTLGVPQAGKTHWLAMVYWQLNRGNYPRSIRFERIKSQSSEDFDVIVEEILTARIGTAATQRDRIPHPVVFNFQDRDPWGRSNVLVNIFDYSGEVTSDMGVEDYRRRRALDGDGFFFFLDPTYPAEPQAKALADFREDIRLVRGVKAGKRVRIPVALCVPKIDILAGQPYALPDGGDAIGRFYDDLSRIDPTGEAMTLDVIEARSRLTARLRDTIWPGWQIERQIHDLFGGRHMFFPLTPVGLDGRGETDLSLRTISPFGLLEPLVWLLEMNGYPILG